MSEQGITGIVLAGGKSSRMGEDKGLMNLNGAPMISYALNILESLTDKIIIVANQEGYEQFNYPVYKDLQPNEGPLGGIITGLSHSTTETNWILACDTPYITAELLTDLKVNLGERDMVITAFRGKSHPLISCCKKRIATELSKQLDLNNRKLTRAFEAINCGIFNAGNYEAELFRNLNEKSDI